MGSLRVLITNNTLEGRAGTELYVRDLATALLRRGHRPVAFSMIHGAVADDLRKRTVPVIDRLDRLAEAPDIIHGHHHLETMMALLHFRSTPAVSVCHGWAPWEERPPIFPRIHRYVAVDDTCRDRLVLEHGIPERNVAQIFNFVNLEQFQPRSPLPAEPRRAAVFSNEISDANVLPAIRDACAATGLTLDVYGLASGASIAQPESILGRYDVIFARARSALEAMAVGAAVVQCGPAGLGGIVTAATVETLRRVNFGLRALARPVTRETVQAELTRYNAADATEVSRWVRANCGLEAGVDAWVRLYEDVLTEPPSDMAAEGPAAAGYLATLATLIKNRERARAPVVPPPPASLSLRVLRRIARLIEGDPARS